MTSARGAAEGALATTASSAPSLTRAVAVGRCGSTGRLEGAVRPGGWKVRFDRAVGRGDSTGRFDGAGVPAAWPLPRGRPSVAPSSAGPTCGELPAPAAGFGEQVFPGLPAYREETPSILRACRTSQRHLMDSGPATGQCTHKHLNESSHGQPMS